jgi:CheY-like chemotaxis protein
VRAESPGKGGGATFTVTLPIAQLESIKAPAENLKHARALADAIQLTGLRILVVDDEAEMRDLLETLLTQHGAQVTVCSTAAQALEITERQKPSLVISDIGMPDEDGYSLIGKIRTREKQGRNIPAIALTGYARVEDRMRALESGFQMYVSKPVEVLEILTVIASLTGRLPEPERTAA